MRTDDFDPTSYVNWVGDGEYNGSSRVQDLQGSFNYRQSAV